MRRSSTRLLLIVILIITVLLPWVGTARAADALDIDESVIGTADWRLRLIFPGGEEQEVTFSTAYGGGEYILDEPYIPIRLLADAAGVPLGWYRSGGGAAVVWGGSPISLVFAADYPDVFYVLDAAAPAYTKVYHEQYFSRPLLLGGSFCLPLAFLNLLGLEYRLDAAECIVTVRVPKSVGRGVSPDMVWQAAKPEVNDILQPSAILLASATTYFDDSQLDRSQNIYLAADSLHRQVIQPGEVFSFNAAVGSRTPQRGYRKAMIFSGGEAVLGYGGGVCQVSTTLYQAVTAAGMQIEEQHSHSLPVSYAAAGQDATVVWGAQDLRWRNNTGQPVYLLCRIDVADGGALTVEIWQGDLPQNVPGILRTE